MRYAIYEKATGRILRTITADAATAALNTSTDELCSEVSIDISDSTHCMNGDVPVAMPEQPGPHNVFDFTTKQWAPNPAAAWAAARWQRSQMLADSDWRVTKAAEAGQAVPPGWIAYRQALRDITLQADPWTIVWPIAPA